MIYKQASPIDWNCEKKYKKKIAKLKYTCWSTVYLKKHTMCELMASDQLNDHHDEFGISVYHSCLLEHRILAMKLSMFLLQIEGIWHVQLDQNCAMLARTIESVKMKLLDTFELKHSVLLYTWIDVAWYLWYSVFARKSSMSIFGKPEINNSNSCSLKIEINRFGMMS